MSRTVYYIESNTGCISNKERFDSWTCPKEGNIQLWNSKEAAERSLKYNKGLIKSGLEGVVRHLEEAKEQFPDMVEVYESGVESMESALKWVESCVIKEL